MTVESTIARAEKEVTEGRLWRAKEILGSSISNYNYSQPIFTALADVLQKMGDDLEAGKYLLLSTDSPTDSQLQIIDRFMSRFKSASYQQILSQFPAAARLKNRDEYPAFLRNALTEIGAPETLPAKSEFDLEPQSGTAQRFWDFIFPAGCLFILGSMITGFVVGAYNILRGIIWLFQ